jgi:3-oxoacyl-[acyl-carrier protein] reductase
VKRALVTGASGTIGSAIARRLAGAGLHVIAHASSHPERAAALVDSIRAAGGAASVATFDVADDAGTRTALEAMIAADGPIQVVVNNAGIHDDAPLAGMSAARWQRVIDVSLNGFFNVTQPLLLPMIRTRWGRIVSVSSLAAVVGNAGQVNYAAAKAGLHGATRALAREVGSRGITVNVVAPGIIATPDTAALFPQQKLDALVPMKRAGTADEVASLVAYLASDEAAYLSGQIISVNGAMA